MIEIAALQWALFAIYVSLAGHFAAFWLRTSHRGAELLMFACYCASQAGIALGAALTLQSETPVGAAAALHVQYAAMFGSVAFSVDFISLMTGRRNRGVVYATYGVCALGLVAAIGGRIVESSVAPPDALFGLGLRPEGWLVLILLLVCGALGVTPLLRRDRRSSDTRLLLMSGCLALGTRGVELALGFRGGSVAIIGPIAATPVVLAVGYVLVQRLVRSARQLEERTAELARSYRQLQRTQAELVRKEQLAAVGELSAVIAHEVRNPLAVFKNAVSTMRHPSLSKRDRQVLLTILDEETDRLNRLVRDLLAYARPVAAKLKPIQIPKLIADALNATRKQHDTDAIEVIVDVERGPAIIPGDDSLLRHALINLIENAIHAMPSGGRLEFRWELVESAQRPSARLSIVDNGAGMEPMVRAKATDPFFTTRPSGTGLGLAIVDRIVKNHHGEWDIDSAVGRGTAIHITLPATEHSS